MKSSTYLHGYNSKLNSFLSCKHVHPYHSSFLFHFSAILMSCPGCERVHFLSCFTYFTLVSLCLFELFQYFLNNCDIWPFHFCCALLSFLTSACDILHWGHSSVIIYYYDNISNKWSCFSIFPAFSLPHCLAFKLVITFESSRWQYTLS